MEFGGRPGTLRSGPAEGQAGQLCSTRSVTWRREWRTTVRGKRDNPLGYLLWGGAGLLLPVKKSSGPFCPVLQGWGAREQTPPARFKTSEDAVERPGRAFCRGWDRCWVPSSLQVTEAPGLLQGRALGRRRGRQMAQRRARKESGSAASGPVGVMRCRWRGRDLPPPRLRRSLTCRHRSVHSEVSGCGPSAACPVLS